jgi:hypothetical protein
MTHKRLPNFAVLAALFLYALTLLCGCQAPKELPPSIGATDNSLNKADAYAEAAAQQSKEGPVKNLIAKARENMAVAIESNWQTARAFVLEHQARLESEKQLRALEGTWYVRFVRVCVRLWHTVIWAIGVFLAAGAALLALRIFLPLVGKPLFEAWLRILQFFLDLLPKLIHNVAEFIKRLFVDAPTIGV